MDGNHGRTCSNKSGDLQTEPSKNIEGIEMNGTSYKGDRRSCVPYVNIINKIVGTDIENCRHSEDPVKIN